MKTEMKEKIEEHVMEEMEKVLTPLMKRSGEMELAGKDYVVVPLDSKFGAIVQQTVRKTIAEVEKWSE